MPGLVPTRHTDIPVSAILMAILVAIFISSSAIIRQNARCEAPFQLTTLLIVYYVVSTIALALRIACAATSSDTSLTLAANIVANVGVVVLVVLHLLLMPHLMHKYFGTERAGKGWRKMISGLPFLVPIPLMPILLLVNINVVILSFFTLDLQVRQHCLAAQKVALIVFTVAAFIPVPASLCVAVFGGGEAKAGPFVNAMNGAVARVIQIRPGTGSIRNTALVMLLVSSLLTLGTSVRASSLLLPARMADNPAWYHERPAYYIFTYVVEILAVMAHLAFRLDRRLQAPGQGTKENDRGTELNSSAD